MKLADAEIENGDQKQVVSNSIDSDAVVFSEPEQLSSQQLEFELESNKDSSERNYAENEFPLISKERQTSVISEQKEGFIVDSSNLTKEKIRPSINTNEKLSNEVIQNDALENTPQLETEMGITSENSQKMESSFIINGENNENDISSVNFDEANSPAGENYEFFNQNAEEEEIGSEKIEEIIEKKGAAFVHAHNPNSANSMLEGINSLIFMIKLKLRNDCKNVNHSYEIEFKFKITFISGGNC